jgi:hypothetical protein
MPLVWLDQPEQDPLAPGLLVYKCEHTLRPQGLLTYRQAAERLGMSWSALERRYTTLGGPAAVCHGAYRGLR